MQEIQITWKICFNHFYRSPSLSYKRNASLSSFCIASSSSSTMNLAANVTNSSNSNLPDSKNKIPQIPELKFVVKDERGELTVSVDFVDQFSQDLFVVGLTHETQDIAYHVAWYAAGFLTVERFECLLQHCKRVKGKKKL